MSFSLKRPLSIFVSVALVAGVVPAGCIEALAADAGRTPGGVKAGVPVTALPQSPIAVNGPAAAAARAPQRVPVTIAVSPEAVQAMTPAQRADLAQISAMMEQRLFTWDQVALSLPGTIFDNSGKPIVSSGDLFKAPQANELERLAIKSGKLNKAQLDQIAKNGTFAVPSEDFPGQSHVWKAAELLQQGYERSRGLLRSRLAGSAAHYVVGIPNTINGGTPLSLNVTLKNVGQGLHETAGLLYGMSETRPANADSAIEAKRREMLGEHMRANVQDADLALYDAKLMEKAAPEIQKAQQGADALWQKNGPAIIEDLSKKIKDPQQLADAIADAKQGTLYTMLSANGELETLHPGLPALIVQRLKFERAKKAVLDEGTRDVRAYGDAFRAKLQQVNPILSLIPDWLEGKVNASMAQYAEQVKGRYEQKLEKAGETLGLGKELAAESAFQRIFPKTREAMLAETAAARTFTYPFMLPRSKWTSEKQEDGTYRGSQIRTVETNTKQTGWRIGNFITRWGMLANNITRWLLVDNIVNGHLGWRALLSGEPFAYRYSLDQETGKWEPTSARRNTYRARLSGFYAQRRAILNAFEKKGKYSFFLGKGGERFIMFFTVDLTLGLIAPLVVTIMQPLLTLANTAVSLAVATSTPLVLGPALSAAIWAMQALLFDNAGTQYSRWRPSLKVGLSILGIAALVAAAWYAGPRVGIDFFSGWWAAALTAIVVGTGPLFPWVGTLVKKAGFYGALASVVTVVKAIGHVVAGPVLTLVSAGMWSVRRVWDRALMGLLRWRARVPAESGRFVKRVAGPGLTSEYFFQVGPDLPLVAAWASMEASELYRYQADTKGLIEEPHKAYAEFAQVLNVLTNGNNQGDGRSAAYKEIYEKQAANEKALDEAVRPRADLYNRLLKVPEQGRIKLATKDLETLLKKTAVLAEGFYGKVMKDQKWSDEKVASFWKSKNLAANDWVGLGKQLQAGIFGDGILTPFEETDKTLRIRVTPPGLEDYVKGLDDGILPGQLDNVSVGELGKPQEKPQVAPSAPVIRAGDLGGGLL